MSIARPVVRTVARNLLLMGAFTTAATAPFPVDAQSASEVESLQKQIEELQKQIDDLRQKQTETARRVEEPPTVGSGNDKVRLSISGQVDRAVLMTNDGHSSDAFFVDNDNSSTRIRMIGEADASDDVTIGSNIEVQFKSNASTAVNQRDERNVGPNNFTERKMEIYVDSKSLGRLSLGQGDTASNSTSEVDLSGTTVVGYSSIADMAGGILFRDGSDFTDITIGDGFSNLDGLSRDDRIRYDTPDFGGFKLSGSLVADERSDIAARFSRQYGETRVAAAIAYAHDDGDFDQVNGSASVLFANGISLTAAGGNRDNDNRDDGRFIYGKVGYETKLVEYGTTAFAVDYQHGEDIGADGDKGNSFGAFAVQNLDDLATDLYFGYRYYDLDRNNFDLDAINAVMTGARVKF
ncbi:MAG: porin [Geminicoccaceae bacterium]|nr:porin [Geminicoccaceae bacterium]